MANRQAHHSLIINRLFLLFFCRFVFVSIYVPLDRLSNRVVMTGGFPMPIYHRRCFMWLMMNSHIQLMFSQLQRLYTFTVNVASHKIL